MCNTDRDTGIQHAKTTTYSELKALVDSLIDEERGNSSLSGYDAGVVYYHNSICEGYRWDKAKPIIMGGFDHNEKGV